MSKPRLIAAVAAVVFLRWLTVARVTITVAGIPVSVPAFAVAAATVLTVATALVALLVYRTRAERAMVAAWQARKAAAR